MADDITKPDQVRGLGRSTQGTGIYWFIDRTGRLRKMFAPRITRDEAGEIAVDLDRLVSGVPGRQGVDAYRWVPERVERADSLISTNCAGGRCRSDLDCFDNACHCHNGSCQ
jgi:hypothetical protein